MRHDANPPWDDSDLFLLDHLETVPGELVPFVERSLRRRRLRQLGWLGCAALAFMAAAVCARGWLA